MCIRDSNEVVIDRETIIEPEHIDIILESGVQNILVHKEDVYKRQNQTWYGSL